MTNKMNINSEINSKTNNLNLHKLVSKTLNNFLLQKISFFSRSHNLLVYIYCAN